MKTKSGLKPRKNLGKSKKLLKKKYLNERRGGIPLLLVDCQPICYASFYAYGALSYGGKPTGVIYGFLKRVFDLGYKFKTNRFIFFWDSIDNYRNDFYKEYKIKRAERRKQMEAEDIVDYKLMLQQMVDLSKDILPRLGFNNNILFHGFEADDLIAFTLKKKKIKGRKIIISNDNDLYQLLDKADMWLFAREEIFTKRKFEKRYGIPVKLWVKAKSIGGCEGDCVPGIEGISDPKHGTSKALKYIQGKLPQGVIYNRINSTTGKEIIRRNRKLVKLPFEPDKIPPFEIKKDSITTRKIIDTLEKFGFYSMLEKDMFEKISQIFGK